MDSKAMTHATETPKIWEFEGDWYMGNDDGPPLCLNSKRAAEYLADIEIRLAAAEAENAELRQWKLEAHKQTCRADAAESALQSA